MMWLFFPIPQLPCSPRKSFQFEPSIHHLPWMHTNPSLASCLFVQETTKETCTADQSPLGCSLRQKAELSRGSISRITLRHEMSWGKSLSALGCRFVLRSSERLRALRPCKLWTSSSQLISVGIWGVQQSWREPPHHLRCWKPWRSCRKHEGLSMCRLNSETV